MNKIITFLIVFLSIECHAQQISMDKAKQNAAEFMNKQPISQLALTRGNDSGREVTAKELQLVDVRNDDHDIPAIYVFNMPEHKGYVIASADMETDPVLGYSSVGSFSPDSLPCCFKYLLDSYAQQISFARKSPNSSKPKAETRASKREPISPLVKSTWSQYAPYNNLCPLDNGQRCITGCVATAMAQILYYHKWPERGKGTHYYEWNGQTLGADFGNTEYHFEKMKDSYNNSMPSDDDLYVATLMYHCGVAVDMGYGVDASSANVEGKEFSDYFGFSDGYWNIYVDYMDEEYLIDKIYRELLHKRPILISGRSEDGSNAGHEFICDGYAQDDFFHFNFGWGGYQDNYFKITAINPANHDFSFYQDIVGGLIPKKDVSEVELDGFRYECTDDEAFIIDGSEAKGKVIIPRSITLQGNQCEITQLCSKAFKDNKNITSVTISSNIKQLSDSVFAGCNNLKELIIEDCNDPLYDKWNSYYGCTSIEKLYLGRDVNSGFYAQSDIKSLTIGAGVTEALYDSYLLRRNPLEEIAVKPENRFFSATDNVLFDKEQTRLIAYLKNKKQTRYDIPSTVTTIESEAFYENTYLVHLAIPASVKIIKKNAFPYCYALEDFDIDKANQYFTFENNTLFSYDKTRLLLYPSKSYDKKVNYVMPNSVKTIDDNAFYYVNISSISLSENLDSIGEGAFTYSGAEDWKSIKIPSSTVYIGPSCFFNISSQAIYVDINNPKYADYNGALVDKNNRKLLCVPAGRKGTYTISESIDSICYNAFYGSILSSVYIPNSVKHIGSNAFNNAQIDSLIVNRQIPPECDWGSMQYLYKSTWVDGYGWTYDEPSIFVPEGTIQLYKEANEWNYRSNYFEMSQNDMNKWLLANAIKDVRMSSKDYPTLYYDLNGNRLSNPRKGMNIIRNSDGKYKKVMLK